MMNRRLKRSLILLAAVCLLISAGIALADKGEAPGVQTYGQHEYALDE